MTDAIIGPVFPPRIFGHRVGRAGYIVQIVCGHDTSVHRLRAMARCRWGEFVVPMRNARQRSDFLTQVVKEPWVDPVA